MKLQTNLIREIKKFLSSPISEDIEDWQTFAILRIGKRVKDRHMLEVFITDRGNMRKLSEVSKKMKDSETGEFKLKDGEWEWKIPDEEIEYGDHRFIVNKFAVDDEGNPIFDENGKAVIDKEQERNALGNPGEYFIRWLWAILKDIDANPKREAGFGEMYGMEEVSPSARADEEDPEGKEKWKEKYPGWYDSRQSVAARKASKARRGARLGKVRKPVNIGARVVDNDDQEYGGVRVIHTGDAYVDILQDVGFGSSSMDREVATVDASDIEGMATTKASGKAPDRQEIRRKYLASSAQKGLRNNDIILAVGYKEREDWDNPFAFPGRHKGVSERDYETPTGTPDIDDEELKWEKVSDVNHLAKITKGAGRKSGALYFRMVVSSMILTDDGTRRYSKPRMVWVKGEISYDDIEKDMRISIDNFFPRGSSPIDKLNKLEEIFELALESGKMQDWMRFRKSYLFDEVLKRSDSDEEVTEKEAEDLIELFGKDMVYKDEEPVDGTLMFQAKVRYVEDFDKDEYEYLKRAAEGVAKAKRNEWMQRVVGIARAKLNIGTEEKVPNEIVRYMADSVSGWLESRGIVPQDFHERISRTGAIEKDKPLFWIDGFPTEKDLKYIERLEGKKDTKTFTAEQVFAILDKVITNDPPESLAQGREEVYDEYKKNRKMVRSLAKQGLSDEEIVKNLYANDLANKSGDDLQHTFDRLLGRVEKHRTLTVDQAKNELLKIGSYLRHIPKARPELSRYFNHGSGLDDQLSEYMEERATASEEEVEPENFLSDAELVPHIGEVYFDDFLINLASKDEGTIRIYNYIRDGINDFIARTVGFDGDIDSAKQELYYNPGLLMYWLKGVSDEDVALEVASAFDVDLYKNGEEIVNAIHTYVNNVSDGENESIIKARRDILFDPTILSGLLVDLDREVEEIEDENNEKEPETW